MSLFDIIAPLQPFDKTASMVAGKGESFEWTPPNCDKLHSKDPIPTRRPTSSEFALASFQDLTGVKIGRLKVMGVSEVKTTAGMNWTVRCVCGAYETRKAKSIKKFMAGAWEGDHEPMCDSCGYTRRLQQGRHHPKKAHAAATAIQEAAR